ncbi:MAG: tetratricopeptide repeat protein [Bryobacterales bacterium]|nr:tetratricopeptide repeat protein [Bryobacterales bacterium]
MSRAGACLVVLGFAIAAPAVSAQRPEPAAITIDYPAEGSVFPPDMTAPTFLWRDASADAAAWRIEVAFGDGGPPVQIESRGEPLRAGEIDPRTVAETNQPPTLTPEQAAAKTWVPETAVWEQIKKRSVGRPAAVTITGLREAGSRQAVSSGRVTIRTSRDPVGAPIFYRDVPLMPSELEKGVIKPLARQAVPLIAWRLRSVSEPRSRVLMEGLHSCANCHSFSRDGKTLGMDLDGPQNDKGLYTLVPIRQRMSIRNEDVIAWSSFRGKLGGNLRVGFMSQVSPDGQFVVTMISPAALEAAQPVSAERRRLQRKDTDHFYVANFKNYRFLQVFYPTRGILAWYSRATGRLQPLPGADDPRYVHTNAAWSPDGKYLVFARAGAKDAYPAGRPMAERANDPNETPIQYDLYRIPFNGGKGGRAEPVAGASQNGMSNTFPKISPDGRWIVYVQCRNGLLMRPDSQLYIVPARGGKARRMRANTPLMNSWHSFSPNGRWLVFSSKSRSPYTQMFLTHIDEQGNDTPAILIENATAANRAVNIPEFVNIPPDGLMKIDTPAVEVYRLFDQAWDLAEKGQYEAAIPQWRKGLELSPNDARARLNLGFALAQAGKPDEAIAQYRRALEIDPGYPEAYLNLGSVLAGTGKPDQAIEHYRKALELDPESPATHSNLGVALVRTGKTEEAIAHYRKALELDPAYAGVHNNLGAALAGSGKLDEAIVHFEKALEAAPGSAEVHNNLGRALAGTGKIDQAVPHFQKALEANPNYAEARYNLGVALARSGRLDEAIAHFEKVLEASPEAVEVHNQLGRTLARAGRFDQAIVHLERVLQANPNSAEAHNGLGFALVSKRMVNEAVAHFEKALAIDPHYSQAHQNLGDTLYYLQGKAAEALAHWKEVLRAEPDHVLVLNQAARVLATHPDASVRNGGEAVGLAERAAQLSGGREPAILDTLAAAYAEAGRFPEAVETARRALAGALQTNRQKLADALKERIALYENKAPLRSAQ